jgi:hypothetical protein
MFEGMQNLNTQAQVKPDSMGMPIVKALYGKGLGKRDKLASVRKWTVGVRF